ncbi:MAG: putative toxin-antitoxin system toxin component, PIN family [Anaerolineae bacterium]|nr:putative toxin-antitoxin system toxin component, PIN family [Anaerolineae bacterium]
MMTKRFVLDTNIILSALLMPESTPAKAFEKAVLSGKILQSITTIEEIHRVIGRKKFDKYVTEQERLDFVNELLGQIELVQVTHVVTVCRDAKDNKFLELALSGNATLIISGDLDLLVLHPFQSIPIITATEFLST